MRASSRPTSPVRRAARGLLGYDVNDCRTIAVASAAVPAEAIRETALGRMLRAKGAVWIPKRPLMLKSRAVIP